MICRACFCVLKLQGLVDMVRVLKVVVLQTFKFKGCPSNLNDCNRLAGIITCLSYESKTDGPSPIGVQVRPGSLVSLVSWFMMIHPPFIFTHVNVSGGWIMQVSLTLRASGKIHASYPVIFICGENDCSITNITIVLWIDAIPSLQPYL